MRDGRSSFFEQEGWKELILQTEAKEQEGWKVLILQTEAKEQEGWKELISRSRLARGWNALVDSDLKHLSNETDGT
jgi:putative protein kinase ArgK-like GTPase of G3E family